MLLFSLGMMEYTDRFNFKLLQKAFMNFIKKHAWIWMMFSAYLIGSQQEPMLTKESFQGSLDEIAQRVRESKGKVQARTGRLNPERIIEVDYITLPVNAVDWSEIKNGATVTCAGHSYTVTYIAMMVAGKEQGYYHLVRKER